MPRGDRPPACAQTRAMQAATEAELTPPPAHTKRQERRTGAAQQRGKLPTGHRRTQSRRRPLLNSPFQIFGRAHS